MNKVVTENIKERVRDWPTTIIGLVLVAAEFINAGGTQTLHSQDWIRIAAYALLGVFSTGNNTVKK